MYVVFIQIVELHRKKFFFLSQAMSSRFPEKAIRDVHSLFIWKY